MNHENTSADESPRPEDAHTQATFSDEEWMTIEQVAEHFGVPATRVREWINEGVLTPRTSGSIELIQRSELDAIGNSDEPATAETENPHRGPSL